MKAINLAGINRQDLPGKPFGLVQAAGLIVLQGFTDLGGCPIAEQPQPR